jgi:histidyl-tRNA synthetase
VSAPKPEKAQKPKARLPRGFRDRGAAEIAAERAILESIRRVYESYGFDPLETPAFEYTDALGKFLPDVDRPNAGVFSLKDDDEQWVSLRYDLTAPLARYVAENFQNLPKPFRRYQTGSVWRNEKPGPGRYREFTQFDADIVGTNNPAADAELLMMLADTLDALGLRGLYVVKLNNRKFLDGVLEAIGILSDSAKRGIVLRAIDKLDRLGEKGVRQLLGKGREDESGDFTKGAELSDEAAESVIRFMTLPVKAATEEGLLEWWAQVAPNPRLLEDSLASRGIIETAKILAAVNDAGYADRIQLDTSVVRGLDYYTGAVFEAQLTFGVKNEKGEEVVFGSVAGGGRYDDLVARFTGQPVPATGVSIGVSRLMSALSQRGLMKGSVAPLVFIAVMDKGETSSAFAMARELRAAGYRAEVYAGTKGMGDQLKYADKRGAAVAVIEGGDERARGEVTLKNLVQGAELSKNIGNRAEYLGERLAQKTVARAALADEVRALLGEP